jgi:hypothetical protein
MCDLPSLDDILAQQQAEKDRLAEQERLEDEAVHRRLELLKPFHDVRNCTLDSLPPGSDFFAEFAHRLTTLATHLSRRGELERLVTRVTNAPDDEGETERHARLFVARLLTMASDGQEQEVAEALRAALEANYPFLGRVNEWLRCELERIMSRYYWETDAVDGIAWPVLLPFQDELNPAAVLLAACNCVAGQLEQRRGSCGGTISTNLFKQFWRQVVALACRLRIQPPAAPGPLWRVDDVIQELARVKDWVRQNCEQPPDATTIEAQAAQAGRDGDTNTEVRDRKGKQINERMLKKLQEDKENCLYLSVKDWADHLGCSKSTVHGTNTWEMILTARGLGEAEKCMRRKEHKPDRRRFMKNRSSRG